MFVDRDTEIGVSTGWIDRQSLGIMLSGLSCLAFIQKRCAHLDLGNPISVGDSQRV